MKYLITIVLLALVVLTSCDRRTSKKEHLENAVSQFNKDLQPLEDKTFYPEDYVEIQTDSIISSVFKVKIKNYASMTAGILMDGTTSEGKKQRAVHRVFESDVMILVKDKVVFNRHISAENFRPIASSQFWEAATLEHVWVDQDHSNADYLTVNLSVINPKMNAFKLYELRIDASGKETVTLLEETT